MREGHLGKRDLLVGAVIYCLRESVRTTDDKDKSSSRSLLAFYPFGKLDASEFLSMLIHQYHGIGRLQEFQNQFSFPFLLLLFAEALGILELRNCRNVERANSAAGTIPEPPKIRLILSGSCASTAELEPSP
mgnify:CR=1 FL=1